MKNKILLIGAGGHCKVVLDVLLSSKEYEIAGIIDVKQNLGSKILGVSVIGTDDDLPVFFKKGIKHCLITVGSIGSPKIRQRLYDLTNRIGFSFPNVISPKAVVSSTVVMGHGNYIAPGVIINADTKLGNNCIINTSAIIEHDCRVGDFVHLAPGSVLSGAVEIGDCSHIGAGAVVIQCLEIGKNVIVGAGSVVTKSVSKNKVVYGNPCKERKNNA